MATIGSIDKGKKPIKPKLFLCRPNRRTIAKLNEAFNIEHTTRLADINELTFSIPYMVEKNRQMVDNRNIEILRERYVIRVELGDQTEYYIINNLSEESDDSDSKTAHCYSLGYELRDKTIRTYKTENPVIAKDIMKTALSKTIWTIGSNLNDVTHPFNLLYRSFEVSNKTVLDLVIEVAETYKAVIVWDTVNRVIDFEEPEKVGQNKGLRVGYGKFLKSMSKESNTDEMITRLTPIGKDGLSVHEVSPTGQGYIEDFSYFLYPFQRDSLKNVIESSYYMSDGLCNAILDYKDLVETKEGEYETLLSKKTTLQNEKTTLQNEYDNLMNDYLVIQDRIDTQKAVEEYGRAENGQSVTITTNTSDYYAVLQTDYSTWTVESKTTNVSSVTLSTLAGELKELVEITSSEYTTTSNSAEIIEKYSLSNKQNQLDAKQTQINNKQAEIDTVNSDIATLRNSLAVENNFTADQITERNQFIIEKEWSDSNYYDAKELYEDAKDRFVNKGMREPQMVVDIDVVNFLEIVEEEREWHKLVLGDTITIKHEILNVHVQAKIIEISYNHEDSNINLKIANVKDIESDEDKLIKALYGAVSTSARVDMSKYKWDKTREDLGTINDVLQGQWDANKREIVAGANEDVKISRRGLVIKDRNDVNNWLIAQNSILAITNDGGKTFKNAITKSGIVGERVMGKLIAGVDLIIENESGKFTFDSNGATIDGASLFITGGVPESQINSSSVDKWNTASSSASTALQPTEYYNGVNINSTDGLVVVRSDDMIKTALNATDGILIQKNTGTSTTPNWVDQFYADLNGNLYLTGNITMNGGSIDWGNVVKPSYTSSEVGALASDSPKLTYIDQYGIYTGTLTANQINAGTLDASLITVKNLDAQSITVNTLNANVLNLPNNLKSTAVYDSVNAINSFEIDQYGRIHIRGSIVMHGGSITWANVSAPSASQVGARDDTWNPNYADVGGTKPPTDADNTYYHLKNNTNIKGFYYNSTTAKLELRADYITTGVLDAKHISTEIAQVNSTLKIGNSGEQGVIEFFTNSTSGDKARIYGWTDIGLADLILEADNIRFDVASKVEFLTGLIVDFNNVTVKNLNVTAKFG